MKKLILFIVLACVSCFAYSQKNVEFRDCKLTNKFLEVIISCKLYYDDYTQTEGTNNVGSYEFKTYKDLSMCTEEFRFYNSNKQVVFVANEHKVSRHVYDKHDVRIEFESFQRKNFCDDTYKEMIKYVD